MTVSLSADSFDAQLRQVLARHSFLRLAYLFGSLASGSAREDSDLDLAVGAARPLCAEEKAALIAELAERFGRPVDLVDLAKVGEPLLGQILVHGRRILGDDTLHGDMICRHLFEQADFLPYRDRLLAERRQAWIGG
ncbi:MAG: nucleotidyltransferase domain-containing protein [Hydrogenophilaceae bacterium]|nr:nucleotidyltransferase domain-containing protein [Hydrogenophilaceae bacterium]